MNVVKELFSKQVPYIYQFDPLSIYNLSRGRASFTNTLSDYFAVLLANKQIRMFGATRRQALISAYLLSSGFRMICHRYPELFRQLDISEPLNIDHLENEWYKGNGSARGIWFCMIAQSSVEVNFKRIDLPTDFQAYTNRLERLTKEYFRVWYTIDDEEGALLEDRDSRTVRDRYRGAHLSRTVVPEMPQKNLDLKFLLRAIPIQDIDIGYIIR